MSSTPLLGTGYTMLPIVQLVKERQLGGFPNYALAVYVTLAVHANRHTGVAHPGHLRISHLAGVSKSTVKTAIAWLEKLGWIAVDRRGSNFRYRMKAMEEVFDAGVGVPLRQRVVFSGLWAGCPPAAKRTYLALLALSRPGLPDEFLGVGSDFKNAFEEARSDEGARHVPHRLSAPADIAKLTGLQPRTLRSAQAALRDLGLVEVFPDTGELVLPNTPSKWVPGVLEALASALEKDKARTASRGAKISASWRLKHQSGTLNQESR